VAWADRRECIDRSARRAHAISKTCPDTRAALPWTTVHGAAILAAVRRLHLVWLACIACEGSALEVHLDLRGECDAAALAGVEVVTVEIYGNDATQNLCTLGRECVFIDVAPTSVEELADVLSAANQPLVDAELAGAQYIHVVGRGSCFDLPDPVTDLLPVPPACGANNIDEIDGDTLALTMQCDAADPCPAQEIPLCR